MHTSVGKSVALCLRAVGLSALFFVCSLSSAQASIVDTIERTASTTRALLEIERAGIGLRIAEKERIENTYTQSATGSMINEATGGDTVKASRPVSGPRDTLKRLGLQLYHGILTVAVYILERPMLTYVVLGLIAFMIIRWIIRRLFGREL